MKMTAWIQTYKDIKFNPWDIQPEDIHIEDIAHALANTCRWGGHCNEFYSVAQHSVMVMQRVPYEYKLTALLHDASEAYIGDMPSPIKATLPDYQLLEDTIMGAIAARFNIAYPVPPVVHKADKWMGCYEAHNLLSDKTIVESWAGENPFPDMPLVCWEPEFAKTIFLNWFHTLIDSREYNEAAY